MSSISINWTKLRRVHGHKMAVLKKQRDMLHVPQVAIRYVSHCSCHHTCSVRHAMQPPPDFRPPLATVVITITLCESITSMDHDASLQNSCMHHTNPMLRALWTKGLTSLAAAGLTPGRQPQRLAP